MAVKVYFKRTLSFIILVCFLTLLVFVSLNRPKEVKAEVVSAVALGVGALAVLVASYFSVAGIELTQNGGEGTTYFEGFINDTVQKFKQADANNKAIAEQYFDDEGRFIGTEEDLQMIISPQARGYWSMGKGVNSFLESLKSWFVSENNLTSTPTEVYNLTNLQCLTNNYPVYDFTGDNSVSNFNNASALIETSVGSTLSFQFLNGDFLSIEITAVNPTAYGWYGNYTINRTFNNTSESKLRAYYNGQKILIGQHYVSGDFKLELASWYISGGNLYYTPLYDFTAYIDNLNNMSVDGAINEGYEDFQDALDNDLSNESENDDAVVVTGVGELGTDLDSTQIKELILQNVITGELNPTYEGTYENQDAAEEDLDKETPIETPDWRPTPVIVNGLEDFFPFCIPFDLYAVIELLNAEPVAPRFTGHLDFAGIFEAEDIVLDFSQFDYLARIVRVIIVIAFLIFIILKTRDMIRG